VRILRFKSFGTAVAVLISLMILLLAGNSLARLADRSRESGRTLARQAIERAVMQCYALEGAYPPDLIYLEENYGLVLDEHRFVYYYEIVAGNIHPIVDVRFPGESE
jgi:hypothetical protein